MFLRNLALLSLFSPSAGLVAVAPIGAMTLCATVFILMYRRKTVTLPELQLGSPISLRQILTFGTLFVVIEIAGSLGQRFLGQFGTVAVSGIGGLVSSASSTAAVSSLSARGEVQPFIAAVSTVVACVASELVNLPILFRRSRNRELGFRLLTISLLIMGVGLVTLYALRLFHLFGAG